MALTHLTVDNGLYSENVANVVVKKLYDVVTNASFVQGILKGTLIVEHAHPSRVAYLEEHFTDLHITMTGDTYIDNSDPATIDKLATLGDGAGLTTTTAANVTSVSSAFSGYTSLVDASFFQYFTGLSGNDSSLYYAFNNCTQLTTVVLPSTLLRIGSHMFYNCTKLTSITIPSSVTTIGSEAFRSCSNLASVNIQSGVTQIDNRAFHSCTSLQSVTIPDSVTSISSESFYYCTSLTSLTIGNSVTSIGANAFRYCQFTSLAIPNSVTSVGNSAFSNCTALTSVNIPESLTSISQNMFSDCTSLPSIDIPNTITSIGQYAFYNCNNLTSVTVRISTPLSIMTQTFSNRSKATLYVPYGCSAAYQAATYWKDFKEIIELPEE